MTRERCVRGIGELWQSADSIETYWLEQTEADVPLHDDWLSGDEAALLRCTRFAKRRADWRLGRWTAKRAAAAYLNLPGDPDALRAIEVRPDPSGAPDLYVGNCPASVAISISHRAGRAVCALARCGTALGCDLEVIERRDSSFVTDYFTSEEQDLISRQLEAEQSRVVTLLWSAKESALKVVRQGLRVDTRRVVASFDRLKDYGNGGDGSREGTNLCHWHPLLVRYLGKQILHGWWQYSGQMVRTIAAIPAPFAPLPLTLID